MCDPQFDQIPSLQGTYLLQLHCSESRSIEVGRLGPVSLRGGFYHYCGSALGPGGLRARLGHHLKESQRPHWHLDYLRKELPVRSLWWTVDPLRRECAWAELLSRWQGARQPIQGFGASDCSCSSHLIYLPYPPAFTRFRCRWRQIVPGSRLGQLRFQ